jgi:hypothetical protein
MAYPSLSPVTKASWLPTGANKFSFTLTSIVVEKCTIVGKTDLVGNIAGYLTEDFCCAATVAKSTLLETLAENFVAINLYYHNKTIERLYQEKERYVSTF